MDIKIIFEDRDLAVLPSRRISQIPYRRYSSEVFCLVRGLT